VKIRLELVQMIALWHIVSTGPKTRPNSSAQVVPRPTGLHCSAECRRKSFKFDAILWPIFTH